MIDESEIIEDTLQDDIGLIIGQLQSLDKWTSEKHALKAKLFEALKKKRYRKFRGHSHRYHLGPIGDSYLYRVPINKRGNLHIYRGKIVRVVCIGGYRFERDFMVGIVDKGN
jgi:hypothetical protein